MKIKGVQVAFDDELNLTNGQNRAYFYQSNLNEDCWVKLNLYPLKVGKQTFLKDRPFWKFEV